MIVQIGLGSVLILASILIGAMGAMLMELGFARWHGWLMREPHRVKLVVVVAVVSLWVLGVVTVGVWLWALVLHALGVLSTLEEAVYFALVSFTTLGYGDVLLPLEWRILGGMSAANGLLNFGLMTAFLVEALRHVRLGQVDARRKH
jgi:hypothetical protein